MKNLKWWLQRGKGPVHGPFDSQEEAWACCARWKWLLGGPINGVPQYGDKRYIEVDEDVTIFPLEIDTEIPIKGEQKTVPCTRVPRNRSVKSKRA